MKGEFHSISPQPDKIPLGNIQPHSLLPDPDPNPAPLSSPMPSMSLMPHCLRGDEPSPPKSHSPPIDPLPVCLCVGALGC